MVCPAKYRKVIFSEEVDIELKIICLEVSMRYEIEFLEIETDEDHVHFFCLLLLNHNKRREKYSKKFLRLRKKRNSF